MRVKRTGLDDGPLLPRPGARYRVTCPHVGPHTHECQRGPCHKTRKALRTQSVMQDDLAALLRALGLGDHARPETPHAVMLSAIAEVERLRVRLVQSQDMHRDEHIRAEQAEARLREVVEALSEYVSEDAAFAEDHLLCGGDCDWSARHKRARAALAAAKGEK